MGDWKAVSEKFASGIKKYKYPLLILLLGIALIMIPTKQKDEPVAAETEAVSQELTLEEKLESALREVDGAGEVRVVLSIAESEAAVYQTDRETTRGAETETTKESTVFYHRSSSEETPAVVKTIGVQYRGALVIAEGGDIPSVHLSLVKAVSGLTGLGADKITVIKMEES